MHHVVPRPYHGLVATMQCVPLPGDLTLAQNETLLALDTPSSVCGLGAGIDSPRPHKLSDDVSRLTSDALASRGSGDCSRTRKDGASLNPCPVQRCGGTRATKTPPPKLLGAARVQHRVLPVSFVWPPLCHPPTLAYQRRAGTPEEVHERMLMKTSGPTHDKGRLRL